MRLLMLLPCVACAVELPQPGTLVDTSGVTFEWECGDECRLEAGTDAPLPAPCPDGAMGSYTYVLDKLFVVQSACPADGGYASWGHWMRPVSCGADADCPQFVDHAYGCTAGICQREADVVVEYFMTDATVLCFATYMREATLDPFSDVNRQVSNWVHQACGSDGLPCQLPLPGDCLDPR